MWRWDRANSKLDYSVCGGGIELIVLDYSVCGGGTELIVNWTTVYVEVG